MKINNILYFLNKKKYIFKKNIFLKTYDRNLLIQKNILRTKLAVHNGKYFIPIKLDEKKISHMLGAFAFSKNINLKSKPKKYNKKKKK